MNNKTIIKERSNAIPIKQIIVQNNENSKSEYSLKQNFFDPSKSSPPNEFMIKLNIRMAMFTSVIHIDKNDDNCEIE
jgi:hypothetical protein